MINTSGKMKATFITSAGACLENGKRLLDEAELLEFEKPPATQHFLSLLAQEELAKAFLLWLVAAGVIPWSSLILRTTRDHKSKQLLCIVMDFLTPDTDRFLARMDAAILEGKSLDFPAKVADAMNILRHKKIGRWKSKQWVWAENPSYDEDALEVAEGKLDREKQGSLYVGLENDGAIAATPNSVSEEQAKSQYERGRRFASFIENLLEGNVPVGTDYKRVMAGFKALFSELS